MQDFIIDQRSTRNMQITAILLDISLANNANIPVDNSDTECATTSSSAKTKVRSFPPRIDSPEIDRHSNGWEQETHHLDYSDAHDAISRSSSQNRMQLTNTVLMSDRYGVSIRATAAIANAVLTDYNVVNKNETSLLIDKSKIFREKKRVRRDLLSNSNDPIVITGLYFDGRRDKTLYNDKRGKKYYKGISTEDHYSLVQEPGSKYIGHVTPTAGDGLSICQTISNFLSTNGISDLHVVGCDGAVLNTGIERGIIRCLEREVGHSLQWVICLLHFNELPLRHMFETIDGRVSGPQMYTGAIGRKLKGCETLPITSFNKISVKVDLPIQNSNDLSKDQKYLYDCFGAVKYGRCSKELASRNPGILNLSRWLTTANRLLRLYMATDEPTINLNVLVNYVMNVYIPFWFLVKTNSSIKDGAKHLYEFVTLTRYLDSKYLDVIDPVIRRNAYFAHPENILLSMFCDDRQEVKEQAIRRIVEARGTSNPQDIRVFSVPQLQLQASDYHELIDWDTVVLTSPPILAHIATDDLQAAANDSNLEIYKYPNHTQAVERTVKLVTEASSNVCGEVARDGFIRSTLKSRIMLPIVETKKDFHRLLRPLSDNNDDDEN